MSFRTVVIANQAKISYKNRFLVVKKDIEEKYIHLSEIDTIIVDSISVSISSYLLKELTDNKINIIFCDEKHNPYAQIQPFYSRHNSSKKIIEQTKWTLKNKDNLWTLIVKNKIINQAFLLKKIKSKQANLVFSYVDEVGVGDKSNREGHASKVYFNALFGKKFSRGNNDIINAKLNYGYAILLSTISKEITNNGYLTQLGIHHKNEFNPFNLACDLMEPFRVIIDAFVYYNQERELDSNLKLDIINIFNNIYTFNSNKYTLKDIIELYVKNTFKVLSAEKEYKDFIYEG